MTQKEYKRKRVHICSGCRVVLHGVGVNVVECNIVVSEFKLPLRYCIHFQTNTLGKGMNLLIHPSMG